MTLFPDRITPILAFLIAASLPAGVYAGDDHREQPMPHIDWGTKVTVRPGETVKVVSTFEAGRENCIQIYDQSNGRLLKDWNNYFGGGGEWYSPRNTSTETMVLLIVSRHKNTGPNGGEPWHMSRYRMLDSGQELGTTKVGFEDDTDGDFNDSMAMVTWIR